MQKRYKVVQGLYEPVLIFSLLGIHPKMTLVINLAEGCHYFLPSVQLSFQLQNVTTIVWYQFLLLGDRRHMCEWLDKCKATRNWTRNLPIVPPSTKINATTGKNNCKYFSRAYTMSHHKLQCIFQFLLSFAGGDYKHKGLLKLHRSAAYAALWNYSSLYYIKWFSTMMPDSEDAYVFAITVSN